MDKGRRFGLPIGLVVVLGSLGMYTQVSANPPFSGFVSATTDVVLTTNVEYSQLSGLGGVINTRENSCVVATVSSEVRASGAQPSAVQFKAMLDETEMQPGQVAESVSDSTDSFAFTFWTCGVAKGTHSVTVAWRSGNGNAVLALKRTLVAEVK